MLSSIRKVSRFPSFKLLNQNTIKSRLKNDNCLSRNKYGYFYSPSKEISIPVPYGQLAAKAWGPENGYPVLTIHGFMDNCGTFDRLIPLLDKSLYVIALDLPGHGFSSHKPPGSSYTFMDMFVAIQYVVKHFNWQKFDLIGHSMGGKIAQLYSGLYPDIVNKLVVLDVIKPFSLPAEDIPDILVNAFEMSIALEEKLHGKTPIYTAESACKRLVDGIHNEVDLELAQILLKRGTKLSKCGTGQVFTRDLQLRTIIHNSVFTNELTKEILSRIKCEMLLIRANNTHPFYMSRTLDFDLTFLELYRKHCKRFTLETVPGNHYVHLNNPEIIAPLINKIVQYY